MATTQGRAGKYAGFAFAVLLASFGVSSCGGEEGDLSDPAEPGKVEPGEPGQTPSVLNPSACAAVARGGKVDICHTTDEAAVPHTVLTVPTESCGTTHALHPADFVADPELGCLHAAKKCKPSGKSCKVSRAGDCCSGACLCLSKKCTCA